MKKGFGLFLIFALTFSLLSTSASAVNSQDSSQEEMVITMGTSTSYIDDNGKLVVEEKILSQESVSKEELAKGIELRSASTKTITNINYFLFDAIECALTATFSYEAGIGVSCVSKTGSTNIRNSSYEKVRDYTGVKLGVANTWVRATYTSVILKPNNNTATCNVWIECSSGGVIHRS